MIWAVSITHSTLFLCQRGWELSASDSKLILAYNWEANFGVLGIFYVTQAVRHASNTPNLCSVFLTKMFLFKSKEMKSGTRNDYPWISVVSLWRCCELHLPKQQYFLNGTVVAHFHLDPYEVGRETENKLTAAVFTQIAWPPGNWLHCLSENAFWQLPLSFPSTEELCTRANIPTFHW